MMDSIKIFITSYPTISLLIIFIIFILLLVYPSNMLIKKVLEKKFLKKDKKCCIPCSSEKENHDDKTGRTIGTFERLLYFIGIYFNNWTLITIVVAIKSIARYSKLDNKEFAEKFLIGTLISLLISLVIGYLFIGIVNTFNLDIELKELFKNVVDIKVENIKDIGK